jgi:hypothetical protein
MQFDNFSGLDTVVCTYSNEKWLNKKSVHVPHSCVGQLGWKSLGLVMQFWIDPVFCTLTSRVTEPQNIIMTKSPKAHP